MSQTRKQIIINKYLEFKEELKKNICDCCIFPDLEDIDVEDLLVLIYLNFSADVNIDSKLNELCILHGVKLSNEVKAICKSFIIWFLFFSRQ